MITTATDGFSDLSRESPKLCNGTYRWPLLDALRIRWRLKYAYLISEVLCACAKDTKQKKFPEENIGVPKLQAESIFRIRAPFVKKTFCVWRKAWLECFDCTPAKLSPVTSRCFQMHKKAYDEKWPFTTTDEKGDACMHSEVRSTVVKWLDWRTVKRDQQTVFSAAWNW